ncbi:unnamed protein product [Anisakis simplex]|uniref:CxC5 domain-containing protein n=1 Tax=Anisakis simplex TaxID=6269 RepID=A0A0M3JR08_ANISI|nr:unnamed protein product [Anisakis simplex]
MGKTSRKFVPSNGNSPPSIFNVNAEADPYLMWMKIFEDQISDDKVICNGPRFKGFHTVTDDQLWGILSILLANYATPFCPICEQMVRRFEGFVYTPNPFIHTRRVFQEEEQHLHGILFAHLPRTQAFCSALMPACFENYATKVATTSNGTECMKCTMCTATLTFLQLHFYAAFHVDFHKHDRLSTKFPFVQHQFLLSEVAVRKALEWLDSSFIHNICAEMCLSFPPNVPSDGGFFPHGVNYTECVAFSNSAFMFAVNAAKNILKPEYFCSLEMGWCKPNETPDIMHCLRQLCEEQMPVELRRTLCRAIPDESIPLKDLLKAPIYGPKLFPTDESVQHNAQYKSEL